MRERYLFAAVLGLAAASGAAGCGHEHQEDMHNASSSEIRQMQIGDAPAAVQSAVQRDFPGSTVTYVGRHDMGDDTHYHVELKTRDGKTVYRTYSPTGQDMSEPH